MESMNIVGLCSQQNFTLELQTVPFLIIGSVDAPYDPPFFLNVAPHAATTVNQGQITQNCRRYTSGKNGEG